MCGRFVLPVSNAIILAATHIPVFFPFGRKKYHQGHENGGKRRMSGGHTAVGGPLQHFERKNSLDQCLRGQST